MQPITAARTRLRRLAQIVAVIAAGGLAAACSGGDATDLAFNETPPEQLYNEGLAHIQEGDYRRASEKFDEVDRQHPYSSWARRSLVMTAYTNYERGNYTEAVTAAERYVTLYPNSEDAAYAQYILGQSHFRQIPDVSRDQRATRQALEAMNRLVERYPESPYADEARQRINMAEDQLAVKEMETGRYYLNRRNYIAAINRFKTVVTNYQSTRHIEEALMRLTEAYYAMGVVPEAQTAAAVLGHNFPESRWYRDAYTLLQSQGLEPRENQGSWITRAFLG